MTTTDPLAGLRRCWDDWGEAPGHPGAIAYAQGMHKRPLDYFVARVRKLGLAGGRVLDAGCGTGCWSFALRSTFDEVIGVDLSAERVAVARWLSARGEVDHVDFRVGSILDTGLPDASVDAVFCYSVLISSIPPEQALAEFFRVLRPGGVLYVSLNGIGWSYYLRDERGKNDPRLAEAGRQGIYNTIVRDLLPQWCNGLRPGGYNWRRRIKGALRLLVTAAAIGAECGKRYTLRFVLDTAAIVIGLKNGFSHANASRGYASDQMKTLSQAAGFVDFQWAGEALIAGSILQPAEPIYDSYYKGHLKVWEFLAFRPDTDLADRLTPEWVVENSRVMRQLPYVALERTPILTNVGASVVPNGWVEEARRRARACGDSRLIECLARKICANAATEEDKACRIVAFVQAALAEHPTAQAFTETGAALLEPATLLFLGIGRCGAAAAMVAALCNAVSIQAEVVQVRSHLVCVARVAGEDVVLDANCFRLGIMPRDRDGKLLSYQSLLADPAACDHLPSFSPWWIEHYNPPVDIWGRPVAGYFAQSGNVPMYSSYFSSEPFVLLPAVPHLRAERRGSSLYLEWDDSRPFDGAPVRYTVRLRDRSRGWGYAEPIADAVLLLSPPPAVEFVTADTAMTVPFPGDAWIDVTPSREDRPGAFYWPSREIAVPAAP